jgi:flagellar biosynthesis/type III secretory pathway chaperone
MLYETCNCISLPVLEQQGTCSLHDLLNRFTSPEEIQGFQCRKCSLQATLQNLELKILALERRMDSSMDEAKLDRLRVRRDVLVTKRIRLERAYLSNHDIDLVI